MKEIFDYIENNIKGIAKIVMSAPRRSGGAQRLTIRRTKTLFQVEEFKGNKVFHKNITEANLIEWLLGIDTAIFRQHTIISAAETVTFLLSRTGQATKRVSKGVELKSEGNNREKNYLLREGVDVPILRDLGIFTAQNKVAAPMQEKFRQINRFLEIVCDVISEDCRALSIVDFGCGKSYLTFILYHYISIIKNIDVRVTGYDLKEDIVNNSKALAAKYDYKNMEFVCGDIINANLDKTDLAVSLHACDIATDYALYKAITSKVKHILCAPCCQREISGRIIPAGVGPANLINRTQDCLTSDDLTDGCIKLDRPQGDFDLLLRHGLIKERFSALLTDAVRAEVLNMCGYRTQVLEFVDFCDTPKNLMIRANLVRKRSANIEFESIKTLMSKYGCSQTLLRLLTIGERAD